MIEVHYDTEEEWEFLDYVINTGTAVYFDEIDCENIPEVYFVQNKKSK